MKIHQLLCASLSIVLMTGCAVSPVKPLYPAEAAKLNSIDVRISAPKEALSVEQLVSATTVAPVGPGVYGSAGILGAVIGAVIVDAIITAQAKKNADALRLQLAGLSDQVAGVDYAAMLRADLQPALIAASAGKVRAVNLSTKPLTASEMAEAARASIHDATLFLDVSQAFSNGGVAHVGAQANGGPGMSLGIRAKVLLVSNSGHELLKDTIVFSTPRSADASNEARVTWWRDNERYVHLLKRSGPAIYVGLNEVLFAKPRYSDEAAFNREWEADKQLTSQQRVARVEALLNRFEACDDFYMTPVAQTRFEAVRTQPTGELRVGLVCTSAETATLR